MAFAEAQERIRGKAYDDEEIRATVEKIVRDVRVNGDEALLRYTQALDGCVLTAPKLRVSEAEREEAWRQVKPDLLTYWRQAKENIAAFHSRQKQQSWFTQDETG